MASRLGRSLIERPPWIARLHGPERPVGAGFLVDEHRVLTCAHVVLAALGLGGDAPLPEGTVRVQLDFPSTREGAVTATVAVDGWVPVDPDDRRGDLAVLILDTGLPSGAAPAPLAVARSTADHAFRALGFPLGRPNGVWATGVLRGATGPSWDWVQLEDIKAQGYRVQAGFSGAPVWDDQERAVVGMVVAEDSANPQARAAAMIPLQVLVRYWPPLADLVPSALQRSPTWRAHWEPRARGLSVLAPASGWYFSGRREVLRELVAWLTSSPGIDTQGRVITGGPGSGKSAVLARLVTLSEPAYRRQVPLGDAPSDTVPPVGLVDVAVHARNKTLSQIVDEIVAAVDGTAQTPDDLVAELVGAGQPLVLVVDAVDEAAGDGVDLAMLLQRLASNGGQVGIRVLVGTRRPLLRWLGTAAFQVLDLDRPPFLQEADLVDYVFRRLLLSDEPAAPTSYRDQPNLARRVAEVVARRARQTFLIAQLTALWLARQPPVAPDDSAVANHFPDTVGDAMESYLSLLGADAAHRAEDLLRPLAYAEGAGLPATELWADLANALAPHPHGYTSNDVGWLLGSAVAFVIETQAEAGDGDDLPRKPMYRLFHDALAEHLRPADLEQQAQQYTVNTLLARVPIVPRGRDWANAEPYIRSHLATHAAAAGQLDGLLDDVRFLLTADPDRLLRALRAARTPAGLRAAQVYQRALFHLRSQSLAEAAAYLGLHAHQAGVPELADRVEQMGVALPWLVRWASWRAPDVYRVVGQHDDGVLAVAVVELGGRTLVASGGADRTVRVWDLATGQPIGRPLRDHEDWITVVAVGQMDGRTVVVSGGQSGTVLVRDLVTGQPVGRPQQGHEGEVTALAVGELDGRAVMVSGGTDGTVLVWDLISGAEPRSLPDGHKGGTTSMAVGELDDRLVVVAGGTDGLLLVWDLTSGEKVGGPLSGHKGRVTSVAVGELDDRPVVVSGGEDATVRVWDLVTGEPIGGPLRGHGEDEGRRFPAVTAVAVGELDDRPVVVSGGEDATVRVWDLVTGEPIGGPLRGHGQSEGEHFPAVTAVAVGKLDDRPVVVSGGADRTIRAWDATPAELVRQPLQDHNKGVRAVAVGELDGRMVVVSGGEDATVRVWDLVTGEPIGRPLRGHEGEVTALAVGELDGRAVMVSGGTDGTVLVWDLASGAEPRSVLRGHDGGVTSIAVGELDGRLVAISGGWNRAVRLWDLGGGRPIGKPLRGHDGAVIAVAVGELDGRLVAISGGSDGTVRMWDLIARKPVGQPLRGHEGWVSAVAVGELDGRLVAVSGGQDTTVRVWDLTVGEPVGQPLRGHGAWVGAVAVAKLDGLPVVISGGARTLRIWHLGGGETRIVEIGTAVDALAFVPPRWAAAGAREGLLVLELTAPTEW